MAQNVVQLFCSFWGHQKLFNDFFEDLNLLSLGLYFANDIHKSGLDRFSHELESVVETYELFQDHIEDLLLYMTRRNSVRLTFNEG